MPNDQWSGKTIDQALVAAADRYGDKVAMVFHNGSLTFNQLRQTSDLFARAFLALGVDKGENVGVWMAGYAEWAYVYFALAKIGAIMVAINTRYKAEELEYVLNKAKASVLILKEDPAQQKNYLALLRELCPAIGGPDSPVPSGRLPYLQKLVLASKRKLEGCISFEALLSLAAEISAESLARSQSRVSSQDVAMIQFTSGTTAAPKGAMLYQEGMLRGAYSNCQALRLVETDCFFSPQPFFHVGGSIFAMLAPIISGCTMIVQPYFDAGEALDLMERYGCNVVMGHQPHYIEYLNHPLLRHKELKLDKGLIFASPEVNRRAHDELGIRRLISPYGLTETHIGGTACDLDDPLDRRMTTVGRPMPGVEIAIKKPGSNEHVPRGNSGEVCFRGWCTMKGYFDDPEKTAEALDGEGWLRTGDLGVIDEGGYLTLIGRIKEMIRVGGENVAAAEVESVLLKNEYVKQAVAVGLDDHRLGEVVAAFVELKTNGQASEVEIVEYCRRHLASFKVPRRVIFVNEWPMSGTGKIQRFVLRESLASRENL